MRGGVSGLEARQHGSRVARTTRTRDASDSNLRIVRAALATTRKGS